MKIACVILLVLLTSTGCRRNQVTSQDSVPNEASGASSERSAEYPQVQWSEPVPELSDATDATRSAWPANMAVVRRHFDESHWTRATKPQFAVYLTENDFFKIEIQPDTKKMVGAVKTTRTINNGSSRGEVIPEIRTTKPLTDKGEVLSLFEAYLKQDGTFDTLARWSDAETVDSTSNVVEQSP